MIIKSMSRKVPSFGQLLGYIDRETDHEAFTLRRNLYGRDHDAIRAEFETNAELLQKRKNGVYLFHEIISITRAKGLTPEDQKQRLYEIAQEYIAARCPDNLVYGGLHQDKDHSYHMHLMISANKAGDLKRQRLTKHQFREIQVQLEAHVLRTYPELEQKLAIGKKSEHGRNKGEVELERRTGKLPKREETLKRIRRAYDTSTDRESLISALRQEGFDLYVRGKNIGVIDLEDGKKHRLKTLDQQFSNQIENRLSGQEPDINKKPEKEALSEKEQEIKKDKTKSREFNSEEKHQGKDNAIKPNEREAEPTQKPEERQNHIDNELNETQKSWRQDMDNFRGRSKNTEGISRDNDDSNERQKN